MNDINTIELSYGAKIEADGKNFLVTFRDLENVFTGATTYQEAVFNAQEVLDLMLLDQLEKNEDIPLPSEIQPGETSISVSPEVLARCRRVARLNC
jgi:antitoxin HicB